MKKAIVKCQYCKELFSRTIYREKVTCFKCKMNKMRNYKTKNSFPQVKNFKPLH